MTIKFQPAGVCAREMHFKISGGRIEDLQIIGGCPGNLLGLTTLVRGMEVKEVIAKLKGITCGGKSTSCPDQMAKALRPYA